MKNPTKPLGVDLKRAGPDAWPGCVAGLGEPPEWFDGPRREAWSRFAAAVEPMGIVIDTDAMAAELFCTAYLEWRQMLEIIERDGATIPRPGRPPRPHPLIKHANASARLLSRILGQFGMTPAGRGGVCLAAEPGEDPMTTLLARHGAPRHPETDDRPGTH